MNVYLHGERQRRGEHLVRVCPGRDPAVLAGEMPSEWRGEDGEPVDIVIRFENGRAHVADNLGRYLLAAGIAHKTMTPLIVAPEKPTLLQAG